MMPPSSPQVEIEPFIAEPYSIHQFQRWMERQHLCLAQRQATMHNYNVDSFTALANAFVRFNPNNFTVQLPVPPALPTYPSSDDDEEEDYSED